MLFVKAHAYGNDFVIVPAEAVAGVRNLTAFARAVCDRHRGVGADGIMLATETPEGAAIQLFNADGSRSEISGNGIRCVAAWLARERQLVPGAQLTIDTTAGPKPLSLLTIDG